MIGVIGFALAAFVLGDFMGYGPGSGQRFDLAKIDKTTISYQEFDRRVNEQMDNWRAETGQTNLSAADAYQMRQQVWNTMLREILLDKEFEQLGLAVTREELYDQIHGTQPHSLIVRSFTDPQSGSFDAQSVVSFLRNFDQLDPSVRRQWANLEQFIRRDRLENKYHSLIRKGYHVPSVLAKRDFEDRNASVDFRFVYRPYAEVADSLVNVSDRDLRRVYDEHKAQFRQEATRSLAYVSFPVFATEEDRAALLRELEELKDEFAATEDVAPFINSVSDRRFDARYYAMGELSPEIDPLFFEAEIGAVHGPYLDGESFVISKLVDTQLRPDSMSASHILISYTGAMSASPEVMRSPEQARQLADSLLTVVRRSPARFGALAAELSDDPSAQFNQGDLEWFNDGDMVAPFNEAVIEAGVGTFTTAESDFGVHVIHVTGKSPAAKKIQVAMLTRDIEPSSRTYQSVYAEASGFAAMLRQKKNINEVAASKEVQVRVAENIREMDFSVPGIENPRGIIQWAFLDDTKVGSHSRVFDLDNNFIIATVTQVKDEGIPPLDQIRSEVMAMAMREKKYEMIARQINDANGSLEAIAQAFGKEEVEASDVRFTTMSLPVAGNEPRVIGTAFTLAQGSLSQPIKGNNGVFVVEMTRKEEAIIPEDLSASKRTLQSSVANRVPNEVFQAIREEARIEDNRNMFY